MEGIHIKVRVFNFSYYLLFVMLNSLVLFTKHILSNTLGDVFAIAWILMLLFLLVGYSTPKTLVLGNDGSLHVGNAVYPSGAIKQITWSAGSRSSFQIVPYKKWLQHRFITLSGRDGLQLDSNRTRIKYWAQQHNIEFTEFQRWKRKKK